MNKFFLEIKKFSKKVLSCFVRICKIVGILFEKAAIYLGKCVVRLSKYLGPKIKSICHKLGQLFKRIGIKIKSWISHKKDIVEKKE